MKYFLVSLSRESLLILMVCWSIDHDEIQTNLRNKEQ